MHVKRLKELINEMNGLDLIVISISAYLDNRNSTSPDSVNYNASSDHEWEEKERIIDVDCKGFIAMAEVAMEYFIKQDHGHLVGISSTSGLRGAASSPVYSAAKACISTYMQGLRHAINKENKKIYITDVIPGFVAVEHSPLGEDPNAYWEITVDQAGETILEGILQKKKVVYVPPRAQLISLLSFLPDFFYERFFNWRGLVFEQ